MNSKIKNILIIGIGQMGLSHFESFYNSKNSYNIDLCDLNIEKIKKNYIDQLPSQKLRFFKNIPKNNNYDLVVISTNSKERYQILKKLLRLNIVNNLILEKFLFNKVGEYPEFKKIIKKYPKLRMINVNSWGNYIFKKIDLRIKKNFIASYHLGNKGIATNLIHICDLYSELINNRDFEILAKNLSKLKSKRNGYNEISGKIILKSNKGVLKIIDKSKSKFHIFELSDKKNTYTLQLNNKKKCYLFKNKKLIKTFDFPMARIFTENFFKKSLNKNILKDSNFNNYNKISDLSKKILIFFKSKFKRFELT
jgi:hypothetical protein